MAHVEIHEVVGTVRVVDNQSLLTAPLIEQLVAAVLAAMKAERRDEDSRRRDTRIGAADGGADGTGSDGERP
jgi:hypothetical protein